MSRQVRRSSSTGLALLVAGAVALAAAACASQGTSSAGGTATTPAGAGTSTAAGSASGSASPSGSAGTASGSTSSTASSADSATAASSSSSAPDQPSDSSSKSFVPTNKLTDTVTQGGFKVKINSVTLPYTPVAGAQFKPQDPMVALVIDLTATNVTEKPLGFSSIMGVELYDSEKNKYLGSVVYQDALPKDKVFPDTDIQPGKSATGQIIFEVPKTAKGFVLFVEGAIFHRSGPDPIIDLGR